MGLNGPGTLAEADVFNSARNPMNHLQTVQQVVTGYVGETLQFSVQLVLSTAASSSFLNTGPHTSGADASNTAAGFVDVLTPGASYITASGINYTSTAVATPEPATPFLLLMGFGGMVLLKKRGFRKRS
jgi:hypothetical protein